MYDHSNNSQTLAAMLRKGDFRNVPKADHDIFRESIVKKALHSAQSIFDGKNPIHKFHLKKKPAYRIKLLSDDLVIRKLAKNIKTIAKHKPANRSFIVANLRHFLCEGVPYRIYRLDISKFYESFNTTEIKKFVKSLRGLSPQNKRQIEALMDHFVSIGGTGLPRGMALSALISDLMMSDFDSYTINLQSVYFYGRYVDDMVIVTNLDGEQNQFLENLTQKLPIGLTLNYKKTKISTVPNTLSTPKEHQIDYLGYRFEPLSTTVKSKGREPKFRNITTEIAQTKVKKIKQRIVRSFLDFINTRNDTLLIDRIKLLTSNYSVIDPNTGKRKLAGIFYSYPMISRTANTLAALDRFLKNAVLSKNGRVFSRSSLFLSQKTKRTLLAHSFIEGHKTKRFVHFSASRINTIQECWIHE